MRKQKDVKFIIYQALYIFVVCVIAIKGANLDLTQVVEDDGKPKVFLSPDSLQKLYEIIKKSIIVDTNLYVIIKKSDLEKMDDKIKQLVVSPMNVQVSSSPINTFSTATIRRSISSLRSKRNLKRKKIRVKCRRSGLVTFSLHSTPITRLTIRMIHL
jgi:hypothetical protein